MVWWMHAGHTQAVFAPAILITAPDAEQRFPVLRATLQHSRALVCSSLELLFFVLNLVVAEEHECFAHSHTGAAGQAVYARTEYTPKT